MPHRKRLVLFMSVAAVVVVIATGYAFRARLSETLGAWSTSGSRTASTPPSTSAPLAMSDGQGGAGGDRGSASADTTARSEVTIDPRRQQLIGVRTVPVRRGTIEQTVRAVGQVRYDETRLADINLKLEGWIRDLYVDYTGQSIQKGQPLFTLYSPDVLNTQNEYLLALRTREQVQGSQLAESREYADRLVSSARRRLTLWDLPPEQIETLERTREPQTAVTFRSPVNGFVMEKTALKGLHVMPGQTLYKIADLSVVWIEADMYENEMKMLRVGAPATVTVDSYPGERFTGRAIYVYPTVTEQTRTVKVRFEFPNRSGRLKPGMYANVELRGPAVVGVTVPSNALLDSGRQQLVFVSLGDGYFEPRNVQVGLRFSDAIQILDGLKEGEQVATGATFFLDSESQLRGSLQGFEAPQANASAGGGPRERLDITVRIQPDPPKTGDNAFEVTVKDAAGKPIDDAQVSLQFNMPAMPTMNMPAMRNEVKVAPAGGGVYRGSGQVMMAGRWDVTVVVSRGGQRIGTKQLAVTAR